MKRVLFIDRDGTLVVEPPVDKQVDSLEKLEFVPKVFQSLAYVTTRLDFEWVMVTNQDGMGTPSFPAENFWTVQRKIIQAFANEGIRFDEVCIDSSFPEENLPTRKPGTAMLSRYQSGEYDLEHSYVIGDRIAFHNVSTHRLLRIVPTLKYRTPCEIKRLNPFADEP